MVVIVDVSVEDEDVFLHLETPPSFYLGDVFNGFSTLIPNEPLKCKQRVYMSEQGAKALIGRTIDGYIIKTQKFLTKEEAWERGLKFPERCIYVQNGTVLKPFEHLYGGLDIDDDI